MEHVELLTLEAMGEVYEPFDGLSWPDQHCVLEAQVCHQPTLVVHHEVRNQLGGANPLQNPELEAVDVHRMRHAFLIVVDLPDLFCPSLVGALTYTHNRETSGDALLIQLWHSRKSPSHVF